MKIGFVNISHADYMNELSASITAKAIVSLRDEGVEVLCDVAPIVSQQQAIDRCITILSGDVDGVILFLSSWVECSIVMTVVQELGHLPLMLWGYPMVHVGEMLQSTGSYVSYAMFKGVLDRIGKKYYGLLGVPGETDSTENALQFCRVTASIKKVRRSRLGMVGYAAMSIYTGTFDHVLLRTLVGPEIVHIDSYTVINRSMIMTKALVEKEKQWLKNISTIADDVTPEDIEKSSKITAALIDICSELELDGINMKCQPEFTKEFGAAACIPLSVIAEKGIVSSCEGDMLCTVSMLILNLLCGKPVSYGDSINHVGNVLTLSSCGFIPYSFANRETRLIRKFMPHPGFSGIQNSFVANPGRMTVLRIVEGIGSYQILVFTGEALTSQLRQGYMPSVDIKIDGSMDKLIDSYNGQHYAFAYGDWLQEIKLYCKLTGINIVCI